MLCFSSFFKSEERDSEKGSVLVESSLVIGVIFLLLLTFFEVGYGLYLKAILTKAAQNALNLSQKINGTQTDLRVLDIEDSGDLTKWDRFNDAVSTIEEKAKLITKAAGIGDVGSGGISLREYTNVYHLNGIKKEKKHSILFLRPTESATFSKNGETKIIHHPDYCDIWMSGCSLSEDEKNSEWESLIFNDPFVVKVSVDYKPLFGLLGKVELSGQAIGFREKLLKGGFSERSKIPVPATSETVWDEVDYDPSEDTAPPGGEGEGEEEGEEEGVPPGSGDCNSNEIVACDKNGGTWISQSCTCDYNPPGSEEGEDEGENEEEGEEEGEDNEDGICSNASEEESCFDSGRHWNSISCTCEENILGSG